jgi:hypothetical protein
VVGVRVAPASRDDDIFLVPIALVPPPTVGEVFPVLSPTVGEVFLVPPWRGGEVCLARSSRGGGIFPVPSPTEG